MPFVKRLSLLPKYLLITAAVCAVAVLMTGLSLYAVLRSSVEATLTESTQLYQEQLLGRIKEHARVTTLALAGRLTELSRTTTAEAAIQQILARTLTLDSADVIVVFGPAGDVLATTGDSRLADRLSGLQPGEVGVTDHLVLARATFDLPGGRRGSVGQAFDATISQSEARVLRTSLVALVAKYGRDSILWFALVSLGVIAAAFSTLVLFARRQVGDIRQLTRSAESMAAGSYDEAPSVAHAVARGDELGVLAVSLSELRERLRTTTISRDYLDTVLGSMSEALLLLSAEGRITRINPAAARLLEYPDAELIGRPVTELLSPDRREEFELVDSGARAQESALLAASGQEIPVSYTVSTIQDSDAAAGGFIIAARNIAERKLAEQRIRYLARIDALTKVPNRMQFQHLLQRTIARADRQRRRFALYYLDLDRFKDINDTYGHSAGDLALETLTGRLGRLLPESTVLGRFAGDEFGLIIEAAESGSADQNGALADTARAILREIARPFAFHGHQIHMTASVGIAAFPEDARNVIDLIRSADSALYHAKHAGGDCFEFFDPEMNAMAAERLMLKSKLRRAYERNELLLHYQPKVDVKTGRIAGAEALVRWELAERGLIPPAEFIPLAEESNLILDIGEWVLDRVCRDFQHWQGQLLYPGKVAVNLSLKQLRQPNFSQRVSRIFGRHGVPPASLELEITESTLMENPERTLRILDELYNMGLSLAIDDFGTGYSSLSALQKFPISTLKIDQSFVRDVPGKSDDATIVSTIVQMGHGLKLDVIAEGVESSQQLLFLRSIGCDYVQGLLFGEAMTADDFMQLLRSQQQGAPAFQKLFG